MNHSNDIASKIYQSLLDGIGDAIVLRDFCRYRPFFLLPHVLETFEGRTVIETSERLHVAFERIQQGLEAVNATQMERRCTVAQFDSPTLIRGVHDTRLLGPGGHLIETYTGMSTLRLIDGHWLVAESQYAEEAASLPSRTLRDCITADAAAD